MGRERLLQAACARDDSGLLRGLPVPAASTQPEQITEQIRQVFRGQRLGGGRHQAANGLFAGCRHRTGTSSSRAASNRTRADAFLARRRPAVAAAVLVRRPRCALCRSTAIRARRLSLSRPVRSRGERRRPSPPIRTLPEPSASPGVRQPRVGPAVFRRPLEMPRVPPCRPSTRSCRIAR